MRGLSSAVFALRVWSCPPRPCSWKIPLLRAVANFANREALVRGDLRLTYAEPQQKVNRLAFQTLKSGLKPKERVIFQLANSPEIIYAYFAVLKVGIIPVMCLAAHRQHEIEYIAKLTEANFFGTCEVAAVGIFS